MPWGVDAVTHDEVMGCAVYCTFTDPVMMQYVSSVARARFLTECVSSVLNGLNG